MYSSYNQIAGAQADKTSVRVHAFVVRTCYDTPDDMRRSLMRHEMLAVLFGKCKDDDDDDDIYRNTGQTRMLEGGIAINMRVERVVLVSVIPVNLCTLVEV